MDSRKAALDRMRQEKEELDKMGRIIESLGQHHDLMVERRREFVAAHCPVKAGDLLDLGDGRTMLVVEIEYHIDPGAEHPVEWRVQGDIRGTDTWGRGNFTVLEDAGYKVVGHEDLWL